MSAWTDVAVELHADHAPEVVNPEITHLGHTDVIFTFGITDQDGIRNQACSVEGQTTAPDQNGNCHFTGLTPGANYAALARAEVARRLTDGSIVWEYAEASTPFTTLIATDSPTTVTLSASNITTTGFLAACNVVDANGATGTCTLRDANNVVVDTWSIGADRPISGLTP